MLVVVFVLVTGVSTGPHGTGPHDDARGWLGGERGPGAISQGHVRTEGQALLARISKWFGHCIHA